MNKAPKDQSQEKKWVKALPWILVICGLIGTFASLMITVEKFDLLQNPNYHPVCDLNPVISCGSVMQSEQAAAFGFMNTYIGLIGFPVVLTIGMAMLAGARFKRWFWLGLQLGLSLGMVFAYWLLYESVYRIGALCPYCLSVDLVLTIAFWYATLFNLRQGHLRAPASWSKFVGFISRHHLDILIVWFLIVIALILKHFWYYYGQQL
jgi:uncharacterized membrane protein